MQKQITENVTSLRKKHGEKQVDLAAVLQVDRSFIAWVESFRSAYNVVHLNKIAIHYNCTMHDIIPQNPIIEDEED